MQIIPNQKEMKTDDGFAVLCFGSRNRYGKLHSLCRRCALYAKLKEFMALYGIIDIKMRMLRIPELKRIMGFPEDYVLVGTQADQKKFIGNAVEVTQAKKNTEALCGKLRERRLKKIKSVA